MIKLVQFFGFGASDDKALEKALLALNSWYDVQVKGIQIIGVQWGYAFETDCDHTSKVTIEIMYK